VEDITVSPMCQSVKQMPMGSIIHIENNKYIESLSGVRGIDVRVKACNSLVKGAVECCSLVIGECDKLKSITVEPFETAFSQQFNFYDLPELTDIYGLENFDGGDDESGVDIDIYDLPKLSRIPDLPDEIYKLAVEHCPKIRDYSALDNIQKVEKLVLPFWGIQTCKYLLKIVEEKGKELWLYCHGVDSFEEWKEIKAMVKALNEKRKDLTVFITAVHESLMSPLNRLGYVLKGLHE